VDAATLVPLSLSDDEGHVAAVLFVSGCNFRCPFCHNADLVLPDRAKAGPRMSLQAILDCLAERSGFLDSVVISGGEPTLQTDLADFLVCVRNLGLRVKLDTNGSQPDVLADLFERRLLDYVAMDLKAPAARYNEFAGVPVELAAVDESVRLLRVRSPDYEFRTTAAPGLGEEDLRAIAGWVTGAKRYVLQPFYVPVEKDLVDPTWGRRIALSPAALREVWPRIAPLVRGGGVRA
jgi:pyruvate formate lyase activating enzyme